MAKKQYPKNVEKFKNIYMNKLPWNFITSPENQEMNLWLQPDGCYQLMESGIKPSGQGYGVFKLPTVADLKGKQDKDTVFEKVFGKGV